MALARQDRKKCHILTTVILEIPMRQIPDGRVVLRDVIHSNRLGMTSHRPDDGDESVHFTQHIHRRVVGKQHHRALHIEMAE